MAIKGKKTKRPAARKPAAAKGNGVSAGRVNRLLAQVQDENADLKRQLGQHADRIHQLETDYAQLRDRMPAATGGL